MRLVKKTVNQDDVSAYHLFYADGMASPGTDLTFFDWPVGRERRGTHSIVRTGLAGERREDAAMVEGSLRRTAASRTRASSSGTAACRSTSRTPRASASASWTMAASGEAHPWDRSPVPAEHQIRGLGPITMSVPNSSRTARVAHRGAWACAQVREYAAPARAVRARVRDGRGRSGRRAARGGRAGPASRRSRERAASTTWRSARPTTTTYRGSAAERLQHDAGCRRAARSTATTSGASTSASPTASCSRSPRTDRVSPPTSRWKPSASASPCRRSSKAAAREIEAGLKPL